MAKQSLKLRGFVVDKQTGKPVSNVVLLFEAKTDDDNATEPKSSKNKKKTSIESRTDINSIVVSSPLGMLVSDNAGYVSLDLSQYTNDKLPHSIQITPIGDEMCKSNVNALFVNQPDLKIHFVLKVNSNYVNCKTNVGLPSIQNPDDIDREVSPHSFTVKNELMLGEGNCQVPIPTPFEQRDFRFGRVVLKASQNLDDNLQSLDQKLLTVSELNPAMDLGQQENDLPLRVAEVLEFRQRWYPVGHSLGQIAYSLPLAPCESVNLAMIDWSRQDTIRRDDQVNSRETLLHDQRRDRTIEETLEAALSESQDGFSLLGGLGVGASATVPIETIPINISTMLSAGGGITHSSGNRDINADSLQELHDRVRQATSVVRSLNSTVIVQATQQEQNVVQTRAVTNHNHCHALTVQYYEVLQTFRVVTEFETRRRVLLIPYKLMKFDRDAILRFRSILDIVLLKPSLSSCFDAVERLANCSNLYEETSASTDGTDSKPSPTPAPEAKDISSYTLTLETGERETWGAVWVKLVLKDGNEKLLRLKESVKGVFVEPEERELVLTRNSKRQWLITEGEAIGINHDDIGKVKVEWAEANWNDAWAFKGIGINYKLSGADLEHSLLINGLGYYSQHPYIEVDRPNNTKGFFDVPDNSPASSGSRHLIWEAAVTLPQRDESSPSQLETPEKTPKERPVKATDECCENRLIAHLNGNIGYYNRAIWLLQDPVERRVLLDGLLAATGLADLVDETPVAVSGRYVAFPFDDPRLESVLLQSAVQEALSRLRLNQEVLNDIWNRAVESQPQEPAKPDPLVTYVSLPTRGLFAEAQLGHCNSCEVRDVTRFWKWDESPCEKAPAIEGVSPGPKGQAPTIPEPASLPNPVVQVMQAPAAPDPVGLAAALNLLGQPNIFRDMSGLKEVEDLLEKLSDGTVKTLSEAQGLAAKAQGKLKTEQAKAAGGGAGGQQKQTPSERFDNLQVAKQAAQTAADFGMSQENQQRVFENVIGTGSASDKAMGAVSATSDGGQNWDSMERGFAITFPGMIAYLPGPWDAARDIALWNFDVGSTDLDRFEDVLKNLGSFFDDWRDRGFYVDIVGVASVSGSSAYNEELSFARALAVLNMYKQRFNMPEARLNVRQFGARMSPPPTDVLDTFGDNELTWRAWNRRVELHAIPEPFTDATFDRIIQWLGTASAPVRNQLERSRAIQLAKLLRSSQANDLYITSFTSLLWNINEFKSSGSGQEILNKWLMDPNRWDRFSFAGHMRELLGKIVQPSAGDELIATRLVEMLRTMHQAWAELDRYVTIQQSGGSGAAIDSVIRRVYTWIGDQINNDDSVYSVLRSP